MYSGEFRPRWSESQSREGGWSAGPVCEEREGFIYMAVYLSLSLL